MWQDLHGRKKDSAHWKQVFLALAIRGGVRVDHNYSLLGNPNAKRKRCVCASILRSVCLAKPSCLLNTNYYNSLRTYLRNQFNYSILRSNFSKMNGQTVDLILDHSAGISSLACWKTFTSSNINSEDRPSIHEKKQSSISIAFCLISYCDSMTYELESPRQSRWSGSTCPAKPRLSWSFYPASHSALLHLTSDHLLLTLPASNGQA